MGMCMFKIIKFGCLRIWILYCRGFIWNLLRVRIKFKDFEVGFLVEF